MKQGVSANYIGEEVDDNGQLQAITYHDIDHFNFAFDIVDVIAAKDPDKLAMMHLDRTYCERRFTFGEISRKSNQAAHYFLNLGIRKDDTVMLVMRRSYQFWYVILALHKIGAIAIPATHQLKALDYEYRFKKASVKAIVACNDRDTVQQIDKASASQQSLIKVSVNGAGADWHDFDAEYDGYPNHFTRDEKAPGGSDTMLMLFTSGTTDYPKLVEHSYTYPLGHYVTAKYWHHVDENGLHLTVSDTGWGKALWGKLYGQWLCEGAVFVYDFDRFDASMIAKLIERYSITSFCAPPTIYRMLIQAADVNCDSFKSVRYATTAGEAIGTETLDLIRKKIGLTVREGYGQTETTLCIANLYNQTYMPGAMGKPLPPYEIVLVDEDGNSLPNNTVGEIAISIEKGRPVGLAQGYRGNQFDDHLTLYRTGDLALRDTNGYFYYKGRKDDVIKSSGYKIGPYEIESVIMELPYVVECGVSGVTDAIRGQIVKASIVLKQGTEPSDELIKEIKEYVKSKTAPYKYPRVIVFRDELPKTISGKVIRNLL